MSSSTRVVRNFPQHGGQELPMLPGHCASHTAFGACLGFGYGWSGLYLIPFYVVLPKRAKTVIWKMGNERTVMRKNKGGTEKKQKRGEQGGYPRCQKPWATNASHNQMHFHKISTAWKALFSSSALAWSFPDKYWVPRSSTSPWLSESSLPGPVSIITVPSSKKEGGSGGKNPHSCLGSETDPRE